MPCALLRYFYRHRTHDTVKCSPLGSPRARTVAPQSAHTHDSRHRRSRHASAVSSHDATHETRHTTAVWSDSEVSTPKHDLNTTVGIPTQRTHKAQHTSSIEHRHAAQLYATDMHGAMASDQIAVFLLNEVFMSTLRLRIEAARSCDSERKGVSRPKLFPPPRVA